MILKDIFLSLFVVLQKINGYSYQGFMNYARKYIISKYEVECVITNCYICKKNRPAFTYLTRIECLLQK